MRFLPDLSSCVQMCPGGMAQQVTRPQLRRKLHHSVCFGDIPTKPKPIHFWNTPKPYAIAVPFSTTPGHFLESMPLGYGCGS